jgi:multidrug efflux pump subunit AcrA (membrane-fusion protein)
VIKLEQIRKAYKLNNTSFEVLKGIDIHIKEGENSSFLRAGYSANADIILSKKDKVMAIPESVLQFDKEKAFVEVETTNQVFEKRFIKTGLSDGINIEVLEGIKKSDKLKSLS